MRFIPISHREQKKKFFVFFPEIVFAQTNLVGPFSSYISIYAALSVAHSGAGAVDW